MVENIRKLIIKWNLNVESMMRHGTIAVVSLFMIGYVFGGVNVMLVFPIALTSLALSKQNIYVKTFKKTLKLILAYWILIMMSFIASLNPAIGIPINFITIFIIGYFLTIGYNPLIYKPFLMLYVFTSFFPATVDSLLARLLSILMGVLIVVISEIFIHRTDHRKILNKTIYTSITLIIEQIDNLLKNEFNMELYRLHSAEMRDLCYKIYITRYRKNFTTNLGKIQFDIYITMEYLNILIKDISERYSEGLNEGLTKVIEEFKEALKAICRYSNEEMDLGKLKNSIDGFLIESEKPGSYRELNEAIIIIKNIERSIIELSRLSRRKENKIFNQWKSTEVERTRNIVKDNFTVGSIRLNFALRLSITLTISLFLGHMLDFYKIIWVSITIMSIMQPYYEETLRRSKDRIKGNIIGLSIVIFILTISNSMIVNIIILITSLYLTYGFKEYNKLSLFTAIASMSIASIGMNIYGAAIYRVIYVILGVIIVILANKFIFPYKLEHGIKHLIIKILKFNKVIIKELSKNEETNDNTIRDIVIYEAINYQKLYLRNLQYKYEGIEKLIDENNKFIIKIAYNTLLKAH